MRPVSRLWARTKPLSPAPTRATLPPVKTNGAAKRVVGVGVVVVALTGLSYKVVGDIRMAVFVFLLTLFAGSLVAMLSLATSE